MSSPSTTGDYSVRLREPEEDHAFVSYKVMLRDFFAAMAMQKLINWEWNDNNGKFPDCIWQGIPEGTISHAAYQIADAMLEARKK